MKRIFRIPRLTLRDMCTVSMLVAITAVLAIYGTFRIGNIIKIPIKFVSVFITAVFYGSAVGGLCAAVGDILNTLLVPVGAWLPQLTALEFLSGFVYGAFFFDLKKSGGNYIVRALLCAVVQFIIDMFLTTAVLVSAGYFPSFSSAFFARIAAGLVKILLQSAVLISGCGYLNIFDKIRGYKNDR